MRSVTWNRFAIKNLWLIPCFFYLWSLVTWIAVKSLHQSLHEVSFIVSGWSFVFVRNVCAQQPPPRSHVRRVQRRKAGKDPRPDLGWPETLPCQVLPSQQRTVSVWRLCFRECIRSIGEFVSSVSSWLFYSVFLLWSCQHSFSIAKPHIDQTSPASFIHTI